MTGTALVTIPADFTVMALDPKGMETAQKQLIVWAAGRAEQEKAELADIEENLRIARDNKWSVKPWQGRAAKTRAKIVFYEKIKAALEAGYYIVPPFPIDVFAIRTKRASPMPKGKDYRHGNFDQNSQALPAGQGEYHSPTPLIETDTWTENGKDGKPVNKSWTEAVEYQSADFPFKLAKPEILKATARAMSLKLFDSLGVLPRYHSPDPIIFGKIKSTSQLSSPVTFFVAWWLDTASLK